VTNANSCTLSPVIKASLSKERKTELNCSRLVNNGSVKMLNLHAKSQRHYSKTLWNAKFDVLTEVLLKIQSFRNVTLHHWMNSPQSFEGSCCSPGLLGPEDESTTILQHSGNYLPYNTA